MSFLVLLLVGLLERLGHWRQWTQRDALVIAWLQRIEAMPRLAGRRWLQVLLFLGVPLVLLALLLSALAPLAYGILLLPAHLLALLWSLGRGDPWLSLAPVRTSWTRGDGEAASLAAERDLGVQAEDSAGLLGQVQGWLLWQAHQGFFAVVFCYVVLGPLGAVAYRLLVLLIEHAGDQELQACAARPRRILDWLPGRLLVLSLALVGNFVAVRQAVRGRLLVLRGGVAELLTAAGRAALGAGSEPGGDEGLDELHKLLQRAALLWYCVLAVWVLL